MEPTRLIVLIALSLFVAGCAADPSSTSGGGTSGAPVDNETGAIVVTVLTSEVVPVEGAQVVVRDPDQTAFTDANGTVRFSGLLPGPHTVLAAKPGFKTREQAGRVVDVAPGETKELRLTLDPEIIVTAETAYHVTLPVRGFLGCSFHIPPIIAQNCGKGVFVNGQQMGADPNDNSTHEWKVDSIQIRTLILEADWTPTVGATAGDFKFTMYRTRTCTATACSFGDPFLSTVGRSPLYGVLREGIDNDLTRRISTDPSKYPRQLWADFLPSCTSGCTHILVLQQSYSAWISTFYGQQAPEGWSVKGAP